MVYKILEPEIVLASDHGDAEKFVNGHTTITNQREAKPKRVELLTRAIKMLVEGKTALDEDSITDAMKKAEEEIDIGSVSRTTAFGTQSKNKGIVQEYFKSSGEEEKG